MPIENPIFQTSVDTQDQVRRIEEASLWAGISKGAGRSSEYSKLLRELVEKNRRSPKHILAWHESADITEMHELWISREKFFPGLKKKIFEVLRSGPVLCQDENDSSSNRARNDAFNYLLAGRMLAAGLEVLAVDECQSHRNTERWKGDITMEHEGVIFDVQCKRPRGFHSLERNVLNARDQIITMARPARGVIAMDLSFCIHNEVGALSAFSGEEASAQVESKILESLSLRILEIIRQDSRIMGLIAFASVPVGVAYEARILRSDLTPYQLQYLHSVDHLHVRVNESSPMAHVLTSLHHYLFNWYQSRWPSAS